MYCFEIIKQPFGNSVVSGFINSDAQGIGIKNKKLYKCYSDELVYNWINAWSINTKPENFGFQYIVDTSHFDWYINLEEGVIE